MILLNVENFDNIRISDTLINAHLPFIQILSESLIIQLFPLKVREFQMSCLEIHIIIIFFFCF